jgi:hypothetical protein
LNLFSILSGDVHLVFANSVIALIDVSSGFGDGNDRIETGMAEVRSEYGEITNWLDLTHNPYTCALQSLRRSGPITVNI